MQCYQINIALFASGLAGRLKWAFVSLVFRFACNFLLETDLKRQTSMIYTNKHRISVEQLRFAVQCRVAFECNKVERPWLAIKQVISILALHRSNHSLASGKSGSNPGPPPHTEQGTHINCQAHNVDTRRQAKEVSLSFDTASNSYKIYFERAVIPRIVISLCSSSQFVVVWTATAEPHNVREKSFPRWQADCRVSCCITLLESCLSHVHYRTIALCRAQAPL